MKKRFLIGLAAMLTAGLILAVLAGCESSPPPRQSTPNERLLDAAANGNLTGVRSALENGANINVQNNRGATALMYAAGRSGNLEIVRYLVERGADLNLRNNDGGWTALHIAFDWNRTAIARYLIDSGINVNARGSNGKSALNMAYEKGEMELYDYLIAHGAREFEPNQVAQPAAPAPQTNSYVQPSAPAQSSTPSTPSQAQRIQEAFRSPLQSGTYALTGTQARINLTAIARSGIFSYTNRQGGTGIGNYSIEGNRMTMQMEGYTFVYTVTSTTSFSGNGETWVRTGY